MVSASRMKVGHGTTATDDGGVSSKQLNPSHVLLHHGVDLLSSADGAGLAAASLIWRVQHARAAAQHVSQLSHASVVSVEQILATAVELLTSGTIVCTSYSNGIKPVIQTNLAPCPVAGCCHLANLMA